MVVTDPASWVLEGIALPANLRLPKAVQGEFDRYVPNSGPANLGRDRPLRRAQPRQQLLRRDLVHGANGGGVFATGNANWVGALSNSSLIPPNVVPDATPGGDRTLLAIMENLYSVIGTGPASGTQPSQGNWTTVYAPGLVSRSEPRRRT